MIYIPDFNFFNPHERTMEHVVYPFINGTPCQKSLLSL